MVIYKMSGDVVGETCPAYMRVKIIGVTASWSYCVLKFLAITVYSLHGPGLISHGAEKHCTLNTCSGVLFALKWMFCFDGIQAGLTEQFVFKACCINKSWLEYWYPYMSSSSHLKLQLGFSFLQLYTQYTISSPVISVHSGVSDTKGLDIKSIATL